MKNEDLIPIELLCTHYKIEYSFIESLNEIGLVEVTKVEKAPYIEKEHLSEVEHLMRLHRDLGLNLEGVEAVAYLLKRIEELKHEILLLKNKADH
ncbi:MAG: hypothetical protein JWO32_1641 [Bacteroidetes bacterium]|nr:hypothetical protein [Bacteroidota bacterium]